MKWRYQEPRLQASVKPSKNKGLEGIVKEPEYCVMGEAGRGNLEFEGGKEGERKGDGG